MVRSIGLGALAALILGTVIACLVGDTKPGRSKPLFDRLSIVAGLRRPDCGRLHHFRSHSLRLSAFVTAHN